MDKTSSPSPRPSILDYAKSPRTRLITGGWTVFRP